MTWIKTVSMRDDERVKAAIEAERKLYPQEYATPVPRWTVALRAASSVRTRCCPMVSVSFL